MQTSPDCFCCHPPDSPHRFFTLRLIPDWFGDFPTFFYFLKHPSDVADKWIWLCHVIPPSCGVFAIRVVMFLTVRLETIASIKIKNNKIFYLFIYLLLKSLLSLKTYVVHHH